MRKNVQKIRVILLVAALFTSIFIPTASAADFETTIRLERSETFSLTASDLQLFDLQTLAPGDVISGKLHIKNTTEDRMKFNLLSIISYAKDDSLFNALQLRIAQGGKELYNGPYGGAGDKFFDPITAAPNGAQLLTIEVSLPADAGNTYQGTEMESIWTFEAHVFDKNSGDSDADAGGSDADTGGSDSNGTGSGHGSQQEDKGSNKGSGSKGPAVKTGFDLTLSNSGLVLGIVLVCLCVLTVLVTIVRIHAAKQKYGTKDKD